MRRTAALLAAALALAPCLPASAAEPLRLVHDDGPLTFPGTAGHLPVGPGVDPQAAVEWARGMPDVRWALSRCGLRGYVRHLELDLAHVAHDPPATVVVLALEKPGLVAPPGLAGAPVVQVATVLDPSGNPHTQVSGGLVFFELATGAMRAAEDVPGFAADATFDAEPSGGAATRFHSERVVKCFRDYTVCAGAGNLTCVSAALMPPHGWWSVARAAVCIGANTTTCLYRFADCWGDP